MEGYLIAGIVLAALGLAVYFYRRKREAEKQTRQNNALLSDFMAAEMAMKASQLESYRAMLRQPHSESPAELSWDVKPGERRRF